MELLARSGRWNDRGDGVEAVDMFANTSYDLILLDIMLPKINGFTVCELIRKQSQVSPNSVRENLIVSTQKVTSCHIDKDSLY